MANSPTTPADIDLVRATLTTHLERALAEDLVVFEELPLVQGIRGGRVKKEEYLQLLQKLLMMRRVFDRALGHAEHLKALNRPGFLAEQTVRNDLTGLGGSVPLRVPKPVEPFERLVRRSMDAPCLRLVGPLYVFEMLRQDSFKIVRPLAAALGCKARSGQGVDLWLEDPDKTSARFQKLQSWLDSCVRNPDRAQEVLEGARQTLTTLIEIHGG